MAKMFFFLLFFLFFSSDGPVQNATLSQWFIYKTAAFYTEQCMTPSVLHNFMLLQSAWN